MILGIPENQDKISVDGINMRIAILSKEMDIITSLDIDKVDGDRKIVSKNDLRKFRDIVESQTFKDVLIKKLAATQKKFDVMAGFAVTESELYSYITDPELNADKCGMSKVDFDNLVKYTKYLPNLYRTFNYFASQLYAKSAGASGATINVDSSFTDSDGKQMNIASNIPVEEDDEISDKTVELRYKVYLDFLYDAACAVKGTRNESTILANALPVLVLLWMEDSFRSYKEEAGLLTNKNYNIETYNKLLFPVTRTTDSGKLECSLTKADIKLHTESTTSYANLETYLKAACLRTYTKHKGEIECNDKIDTDCFVFARYIYRMFQILGIELVEKNPERAYSRGDIIRRLLDSSNPKSLKNLIPDYKFSPKFYNQTKSLTDWFTKTDTDIDDDYVIGRYTALENKIEPPVFNMLSTATTGHYPLSVQTKTGAILDDEAEVQHILQLMHLAKLLGTGVTNSDLYSELLSSKRDRVILFEPMLTASNSKPVGQRNISDRVNMQIGDASNDIFYKVSGLNIDIYDQIMDIADSNKILADTSKEVKDRINGMIDTRIEEIADLYMNHYFNMGWSFPFMGKRENLVDMIRNTKRSDYGTNFIFLLGDCLTVDVYKESHSGRYLDTVKCAVTCDYKLVRDNTIYEPFLFESIEKVTELERQTKYGGQDLGKPDKSGKYAVKTMKLGIKDPVSL